MTVRPEHREQKAFQARGVPVLAMIVSVVIVPVMIVSVVIMSVVIVPVMIVLSLMSVTLPGEVLMVVALGRWATRRSRRRMLVRV
ncbi:MAG TPA: hypothetical protein VKB85_17150 [Propionibacteriaceae bacterium]|nr:hypothetical protein [Propionibacteriaceae bacterium]